MIREIGSGVQYDSRGYTDEHALAKLYQQIPDSIGNKLTTLYGSMEFGKRFSFLANTEGAGYRKTVKTVDYTWPVAGEAKHTAEVVSTTYVAGNKPGFGHLMFSVVFRSNIIIPQYGLIAPDGVTQAYVHGEPNHVGGDLYEYTLQLKTTDATAFCDLDNLVPGRFWVMSAPKVAESGSVGNRSNIYGSTKMTNMLSFHRFSKIIQGNLANKVSIVEFSGTDTKSGGKTNLWINEEMRQFELDIRELMNGSIYTDEYNRDLNGVITLKDEFGKPIPIGAGVRQAITDAGNYDTYGYSLNIRKIKNIVSSIFYGTADDEMTNVLIHAGQGFMEDFHEAIFDELGTTFTQLSGDKFISGPNNFLKYGGAFRQYLHSSGRVITIKHDIAFDTGMLAELDIANGNYHPRTNMPMSSHTGVFMDYSTYNGERNIEYVTMEGQSYIAKVIPGMAPIPASWGAMAKDFAATEKDESSYQIKMAGSVNIKDAGRCFILKSEL